MSFLIKGKSVHFDDRYLHVELIEWVDLDYHLSVESMLLSQMMRKAA